MSFNRTIGALEKCGDRKTLTLEDILGIITVDLFGDISSTSGSTVTDLSVFDETRYSKYFVSLVKYVRRFAEKHSDILSRENRLATWEKENNKISEVTGDIDKIDEDIQRIEAKLSELKSKEDEYKKRLAEKDALDEQIMIKTQLLSELDAKVREADEIESIINDLRTVKIPEINSLLGILEGNKSEFIAVLERYNSEVSNILSEQRDQALDVLRSTQSEFEGILSDWTDAEEKCGELRNQSEQYSSAINSSKEKAENLRRMIDLMAEEHDSITAEIAELEERRQKEETSIQTVKAEADEAAALLEKAISENLSIGNVRDEFKQRLEDKKKEKEGLDQEIESLGRSITDYETEAGRLEKEIFDIRSNNSDIISKIDRFKAQILEEKQKYDDSLNKMKNYRLEYMISKKRADAHFKDYEIFLKKYADIQSDYGKIIGDFLNDESLKERWTSLTDENLMISLNSKKNELDSLLKIELASIAELLRQYDD